LTSRCAFYLRLAQQASPELTHSDQRRWLERLEREHDNLRLALAWSFEEGDTEVAMQFGAALWRFWRYRGHLTEATRWIERLLALPVSQTYARQQVLFGAGMLAFRTGARDQALAHFEELRKSGAQMHPGVRSGTFTQLGHLANSRNDLEVAERFYHEARAICHEHSLVWNATVALLGLALVALRRRNFALAREFSDQALQTSTELGERMLLTDVHQRLGTIDLFEGDLAAARKHFGTALQLSLDFGNLEGQIESLEFVAYYALSNTQPVVALRLFGAAHAHREALGFGPFDGFMLDAVARARPAEGADDAWAAGRNLSLSQAVAEALHCCNFAETGAR
jgi:tetratricopeptide (TPR) repeat protein